MDCMAIHQAVCMECYQIVDVYRGVLVPHLNTYMYVCLGSSTRVTDTN